MNLARLEGERHAEQSTREDEQRDQQRRAAEAALKSSLAKFGTVKETAKGFQLLLPESIWSGPRATTLVSAAAAKLEPLAALLASNPDYQVVIETYTDGKGDEVYLAAAHAGSRARVIGSLSGSRRRGGAAAGQWHGSREPFGEQHDSSRPGPQSPHGNYIHAFSPQCVESVGSRTSQAAAVGSR